MKKIIGLSCGRKNGNCETLLKEAAMGAEEFGVETEIIRAMATAASTVSLLETMFPSLMGNLCTLSSFRTRTLQLERSTFPHPALKIGRYKSVTY